MGSLMLDAIELRQLRQRIDALRNSGRDPMEVMMSPETWSRLQQQHRFSTPNLLPKRLSVREVLGVRGRLVPGIGGCTIRYFGGMDLPPNIPLPDTFIDPSRLPGQQPHARDRQG